MTPDHDLAHRRFVTLTLTRVAGLVLMIVGLVLWHTSLIRAGGVPGAGAPVFFAGFAVSVLVPRLLMRRWRGPRG